MRLLDAYIARQVALWALVALAVLVALSAVVTFVDDLDSVGQRNYGIREAIEFTILTLPRQAFVLFPFAAVIGTLVGLGALSASSELSVVRTSGVSSARVVGSVLKGAALLVICAVLIGEVAAPYCERLGQSRRTALLAGPSERADGFWVRDGQRFVNVTHLGSDDRIEDLFVYELDTGGGLRAVMHAESGEYRDSEWILQGIRESELSQRGIEVRTAAREVWPARFRPDFFELASARMESLSVLSLARYIDYLRDNRLETAVYELALWKKVAHPLSTGVMIFLAAALALGRLGGSGAGQRILAGCLIAVTFHVVNEIAGEAGIVYGISPPLSAFAPTLVFLATGWWLLHRAR